MVMAGYLYNYQSKEFYNLSYTLEVPEVPAKFGGLFIYPFSTPHLKRLFSWFTFVKRISSVYLLVLLE